MTTREREREREAHALARHARVVCQPLRRPRASRLAPGILLNGASMRDRAASRVAAAAAGTATAAPRVAVAGSLSKRERLSHAPLTPPPDPSRPPPRSSFAGHGAKPAADAHGHDDHAHEHKHLVFHP